MFFKPKHLHSIDVGHFKNTAGESSVTMPDPDVVKISLGQNIGAPCEPLVAVGDHVKKGQPIGDTEAYVSAPVHASISGNVKEIRDVRSANGGKEQLVIIENDGENEIWEGVKPPEVKDKESFLKAVRASGLIGMGGAAFPAHVKFNPKNFNEVKTLIINGAECEPFITSDHREMLEDAEYVLYAALTVMKYLNLNECFIGIEDNKPDAIKHFEEIISKHNYQNVSVFPLQAKYPKGAERVIIYEVTGKEVAGGMLPADVGCIVSNVSSLGFLGHYLKDGMPLVNKRVTVDGDSVAKPANVIAPIGTRIEDIVEFCGGYSKEPTKIIMGGPMMGRSVISDRMGLLKNNNAILVFSRALAEPSETTSCINCGRCHAACPFGLLPTAFADAYDHKDTDMLNELHIMDCMECGCCSYVCPARRPLCFMNKMGKIMVKEAARK